MEAEKIKEEKYLEEDEIDLKEIFNIFKKRKWWFIGTVLIILIIGAIYIFLKPVNYETINRIRVEEEYINIDLYNFYENYKEDLNFFSLEEVPALFNSPQIFETANQISDKISDNINLGELFTSGKVKVTRVAKSNLFEVRVSDPNYELSTEINNSLVQAFKEYIKSQGQEIFNKILSKIDSYIKELETRNNILMDEKIKELETETENLYEELDKYIVDYNKRLYEQLNKEVNSNFYNIIIPPNKIKDNIDALNNEIHMYKTKVMANEEEILGLKNLHEVLVDDETLITDRIEIVTEEPIYNIENNKIRDLVIVIILSLILGVAVVFIVNYIYGLRTTK